MNENRIVTMDLCNELPTVSTNIIHNIDYTELIQQLPDGCVNLILTDPPYGIEYQNNFTRNKKPRLSKDMENGIDYAMFAEQCYRILKNNSHAYFFTRFDKYPYHYSCLTQAGFNVKNCLIIEKGHIGGIGDLYGSYANNSEWIIFCHKGRRLFYKTKLVKNKYPISRYSGNLKMEHKTRFNNCWFGDGYPKATPNSSWSSKNNYNHPTMKNVECLEWLIQISSEPDSIVFDPFIGSGTTALAAVNTGRRYLGCEIDPAHYQLSQTRLAIRT